MKRTPFKRKRGKQKKARVLKDHYEPPEWFMHIKPGSHGSTPAQKRLWRLVSESIRQEEFLKYGGRCVSCPRRLESWQDGQCAHYKPWSVSHGSFKFERKNLALSCSFCNQNSGADIGHEFGEELKRRYGKDHLEWIQSENEKHRGEKMEVWQLVELAKQFYDKDM